VKRLVVLAPNWLGDAVMAVPAIADVRRASPHAEMTVAARPSIAPLFTLVSEVDRRLVIDTHLHLRTTANELANQGFDTALLLPNSMRAALVVALAGIPNRWGYRANLRGALLTRAIARPSGLHQAEYYQQLVHALGFPNGPMEPRITLSPSLRATAAALLRDAGWDGRAPLVALAPGAAYGAAKRWPPERFAALAASLAADGVQSVMIGAAADRLTADEVSCAFQSPALLTLVGRTDLPTLAGVLAACRALVTNDSGAMHLAAAAGTSVTAVFGPTDERATRPLGDAHQVVTFPVWCRPCMLRECPLDHRCMRGVDAAVVAAAARRTL
jgi:heptosyltransferase-2